MDFKEDLCSLIFLSFCLINFTESFGNNLPCSSKDDLDFDPPPTFPRNFRAEYEFVVGDYSRFFVTLNYDGENDRISIVENSGTLKKSLVLDYKNGHSVVIDSKDSLSSTKCSVNPIENTKEYRFTLETMFPFLEFKPEDNKLFAPDGLFGANDLRLLGYLGEDYYRDEIPSRIWVYCYQEDINLPQDNVFVYWSQMYWDIPGDEKPALLGYKVKNFDSRINSSITKLSVNVVYMSDDVDQLAFNIPEDLECTMTGTLKPLPFQTPSSGVVHFLSEIISPEKKEIMKSESWFDLTNSLGKIRYHSNGTTVTNIADLKQKIVYVQRDGDDQCSVQKLKAGLFVNLTEDEFTVFHLGNLLDLFGPSGPSNWIYIGQRVKRELKTDVWQRRRTDWPYPKIKSVVSLWDWHFINKTNKDGDVYAVPVHLQIMNLDKNPHRLDSDKPTTHYSIQGYTNKLLDFTNPKDFDIGQCFSNVDSKTQYLAFQVEVVNSSQSLEDFGLFDYTFLQIWRATIAGFAEVDLLRISQTDAIVMNNKLYIQFLLLDIHPKSPEGLLNDQPSVTDAKAYLNSAIDSGVISIPINDKEYKAIANTLTFATKQCAQKTNTKRRKRSINSDKTKQQNTQTYSLRYYGIIFVLGLATGSASIIIFTKTVNFAFKFKRQ